MAIIKTVEGKTPHWGKNCFIAENAALTGDCVLGDDCSIWYSAVLYLKEEYSIREIRPSDDESIRKIARSAFEEFGAPLTGSVYCDPRMEHLSNEFVREDAKYWVIEGTDGEILGGGGFYPTEGLPSGMAEVVKLYFSPSLRGKGYGRKMLSLIEQEAKKAGYKELYIESFPEFAKAVRLYEKIGFKHIPHALGNSGHPAVTVWMTKEI